MYGWAANAASSAASEPGSPPAASPAARKVAIGTPAYRAAKPRGPNAIRLRVAGPAIAGRRAGRSCDGKKRTGAVRHLQRVQPRVAGQAGIGEAQRRRGPRPG